MRKRVVTIVAALALASVPTLALAAGNGNGNGQNGTTGTTGPHPRGHAYGFYCQGQSKKHVKGQKGTPFSQCVHAMKALSKGTETNPAKACKSLSKHEPGGLKGTPFSRCVSSGAKLLKDQNG